MPELPEVETIRRQLEREIKGAEIKSVEVRNIKPLNVSKEKFISAVRGAKIKEVDRRAKLLLLMLSNGNVLMFHLKMTGRMLLAGKKISPTKHTHIIFVLSAPHRPSGTSPLSTRGKIFNLFFEDYRKFGFVKLLKQNDLEEYFSKEGYGPEPLSETFTLKILKECLLAHPNKKIKQILMEQLCVAGIGNIYASEICFFAGVSPDRKISDISEDEFKKIFNGIKKILSSAVESRGTSADAYVDAYGRQGEFLPKLKVYGREGEKCLRCGGVVKKEKMGGRGTYWCPKCQR